MQFNASMLGQYIGYNPMISSDMQYNSAMAQRNHQNALQDVNASTELVYPVVNGNSMNKKLEAAKAYLKACKG